MATITKRVNKKGKPTYRVRVRLRGHPAVSATFDRLTDAKEWARQTGADIRAGRYLDKKEAQRRTLNDLFDEYEKRRLPMKKERTQIDQRQQIKWWRGEIGALTLANTTPARINDCINKMSDVGRSPATINRYLAVLSHAFTYAVKDLGWMEDNPIRKITKPKEPRGRVRFLSADERERLLEACKQSSNGMLYPAVVLAMSTGMRRGEQFSLTWNKVNLDNGRIVLEDTKNGERRTVVATGIALDELRRMSKVRRIDNPHVFPGKKRGQPVDLCAPWRKALKAAEIEDFHWHDLRHTFASELAMSGATLAEIAEAMGHKTLAMVKRYAHLTEGHVGSVVERMTARVFGGGA